MTVAEMIAELQKHPPDWEIKVLMQYTQHDTGVDELDEYSIESQCIGLPNNLNEMVAIYVDYEDGVTHV